MTSGRRGPRAFTIIELLVIVAILGVLMGMLLPALGAARDRVRKTQELSDLRQVGLAWTMYANHHNGAVLPGYLEAEAQEKWRVRYQFPTDQSPIPPAPNFSPGDPNIAGPYPWRLMPFLDYNHETLHGYRKEAENDIFALIREAEEFSVTPAFGYNAFYVGGWMELRDQYGGGTRVVPRYSNVPNPLKPNIALDLIVNTLSEVRKSSELVVFCSSSKREVREFRNVPDNIDGAHFVVPPLLADKEMWGPPDSVIRGQTSEQFPLDQFIEVRGRIDGMNAPVPIARFTSAAAVLYADGHVDNQSPLGLYDQRKWINTADEKFFEHQDKP